VAVVAHKVETVLMRKLQLVGIRLLVARCRYCHWVDGIIAVPIV
jgi:hypothetical protein